MKIYKLFFFFAAITAVTLISGCDGSDDPSDEEVFLKKLSYQWTLTSGSVTVDGVDVTQAFAGMAITFTTSKSYSVSNAVPPIWPAGGTFEIEKINADVFDILRDDGVRVSVIELTENTVTLSLDYVSSSSGRANGKTKGTSGHYVFKLKH